MYANLSQSTLRSAKKLIALYRRGKLSPKLLASWHSGYTTLPTRILGKVHRLIVGKSPDLAQAEALLSLAEHLVNSQLYNAQKYHHHYSRLSDRSFIGLEILSRFHRYWIRPVEDFPIRGAADDLLMALYDHLFVQYPVPKFFYNALFRWQEDDRIVSQIEIGQGKSVRARALRTKFTLSLKARPWPRQAHDSSRYDEAMRRGFYKSFGASDGVVEALMPHEPQDTPFWYSVYRFFVENEVTDPAQVTMILKFIRAVKFRPQGYGRPPVLPEFEIQGRTLNGLLRLAQDWLIVFPRL
jgi:hypothetical protein